MLRINVQNSASGAKSYYSHADYYSEGQELVGRWRGKGAERLGLFGEVQQKQWERLCDNRHLLDNTQLTVRQKSQRRIGYDFNFHAPKSVSLIYGLTGDARIVEAMRDAVGETMRDIETEAKTRIRKNGKDEDRVTGNLVWGEFTHLTARPVDGVPDPHLHAHCFVFNTTFDPAEQRWKAAQFADIKRDGSYFEGLFHARLAMNLRDLGYGIERTRKGWEIGGVPASAIRKFSRRSERIEEKARREGVTDPVRKAELGAKTREKKNAELTLPELRQEWRQRLSDEERDAIAMPSHSGTDWPLDAERSAEDSAKHAVGHCFERSAVVPLRTLQAVALKRGAGSASAEQLLAALDRQQLVTGQRGGRLCATTCEVLAEEARMLTFARNGRGSLHPLVEGEHAFTREWLNDDQRRAVKHVLGSRDRVTLIRGAAGVGKTTMMKEAVEAIEKTGTRVFTFAPSADASRVTLRSEGFHEADTLARLLVDTQLQQRVHGQVLWIDEAGLIGSRDMARLFDLAKQEDARIVLSGDRRQHGAVARGAPLALLEDEAGVRPAEIREIQRQDGKYKQAVKALSEGRVGDGLNDLRKLGWIREVRAEERYQRLAADYVAAVGAGETALVVSPTHAEGERITSEIRSALRRKGRIDDREESVLRLVPANLTEAERRDAVSYVPGDVLVFHQNAPGYRKGQRIVAGDAPLPLRHADRFQVYRQRSLNVAVGDLVRVTRNGATADGAHRLTNGSVYAVKAIGDNGDLTLSNGWRVGREFGHLDHGYVVTSHASQGKTVQRVFIGQSAASLPASSREQFYVSVSRGRKQAVIYTDDAASLLEGVSRAEDHPTATGFMNEAIRAARVATMQRQSNVNDYRRENDRELVRER